MIIQEAIEKANGGYITTGELTIRCERKVFYEKITHSQVNLTTDELYADWELV